MTTSVEKTGDGRFKIRLGSVGKEAEADLSLAEVKTLLVQVLAQMAPGAAPNPAENIKKLMKKLIEANDVGVETLIRGAADDDMLVLLKSAEKNEPLCEKLYRNMSERSRKMYQDDLGFRFTDGIPDTDLGRAANRLATQARALEGEGLLQYGA